MAKIKFMGTSHVRRIDKGETWDGRLAEATTVDVVFDDDNNHVIDTEELGLSPEAVELLLEDQHFKDVTDLKRIPASAGDKLWRGVKEGTPNETVVNAEGQTLVDGEPVDDGSGNPDAVVAGSSGAGGAQAAGDTPPSPVGGSTATAGRSGRSRTSGT